MVRVAYLPRHIDVQNVLLQLCHTVLVAVADGRVHITCMDMRVHVLHVMVQAESIICLVVVMDIQIRICTALLITMIIAVVQAIHIALMERHMYMTSKV